MADAPDANSELSDSVGATGLFVCFSFSRRESMVECGRQFSYLFKPLDVPHLCLRGCWTVQVQDHSLLEGGAAEGRGMGGLAREASGLRDAFRGREQGRQSRGPRTTPTWSKQQVFTFALSSSAAWRFNLNIDKHFSLDSFRYQKRWRCRSYKEDTEFSQESPSSLHTFLPLFVS